MSEPLAPEHFSDWNEEMIRLYDQESFASHPVGTVRRVEEKRIATILRGLQVSAEHRILDAGCGTGTLLTRLRGRELHGVDLSPFMVSKARERAGNNAAIAQADAEKLPFPDASFDRVVASSLFSHVLHPETVASELARVTKPGGRVVISVSDEAQIEKGIRWIKMLGLSGMFGGTQGAGGKGRSYNVEYHLHRFSRERLRETVGTRLNEVSMRGVPFIFPVHWVGVYTKG